MQFVKTARAIALALSTVLASSYGMGQCLSMPQPSNPLVQASMFDFLDSEEGETAGAGLYTYLLAPKHDDRIAALLFEVFRHFDPLDIKVRPFLNESLKKMDISRLNVIYIPVEDAKTARVDQNVESNLYPNDRRNYASCLSGIIEGRYEYSLSRRILQFVCSSEFGARPPAFCKRDYLANGPYLITIGCPVGSKELGSCGFVKGKARPGPGFSLDLTNYDPRAFPVFINSYREYVLGAVRPNKRWEAVTTLRGDVANAVVKAARWLEVMSEARAKVIDDIRHR